MLKEKFDVKMFMAVLQQGTDYDLKGGMSTVRKVLSMKPMHLAKELKEIEYLLDRLAKAEEPFTAVSATFSQPPLLCCVCIISISTSPNPPYACALVIFQVSWQDTTTSWFAMRDLIAKLNSQRAQAVLDCIFAGDKVCPALGAAQQLMDIANADSAPVGLIVLLKQGPGAHIKSHYYEYVTALNNEIAHIQRIQNLQQRAVGLIGAGIISVSVGVANFLSTMFYSKVATGHFFPNDDDE